MISEKYVYIKHPVPEIISSDKTDWVGWFETDKLVGVASHKIWGYENQKYNEHLFIDAFYFRYWMSKW